MDPFFAVLNPDGRDRTQLFAGDAGQPGAAGHPPINYHAYAACLGGGFYRHEKEVPESVRGVLVLLRRNGLEAARRAVRNLRQRGTRIFISWKESGLHQVAGALSDPRRYESFRTICGEVDGYLSSTSELVSLYQAAGCARGEFLPTPYPIDQPGWDFSRPLAERAGIFIGTREFDVPSRNHLLAISTAVRIGTSVTVVNPDGREGKRLLRAISAEIEIVPGPLAYEDYLRLMARHRVVFQLDRSAVPGQVAGDALLCRSVCVGGDGAVDRLAFAATSGTGRSMIELGEIAGQLLRDEAFYLDQVTASQSAAEREISFAAGRRRLENLLA